MTPTIKQLIAFAKGGSLHGDNSFIVEISRDINGKLYFEKAKYIGDIASGGRRNVAFILNKSGRFIPDEELKPLVEAARQHLLLYGGSTPIESTYTGARTPQKLKVY